MPDGLNSPRQASPERPHHLRQMGYGQSISVRIVPFRPYLPPKQKEKIVALVFNIERITASQLKGQRRHDQRIDKPPNCDPKRQHLNRVLEGSGDPVKDVEAALSEHKAKPRADNDRPYTRIVLSASPDELDTPEKVDEFEAKSMKWLRKHWGPGLVYGVAHLDEETYHIHAVVVPLYSVESRGQTRNRVSHRLHPATKGKDSYTRLRQDAAHSMGLDYGEPGGKPQSLEQRRTLGACRLIEADAKAKADAIVKSAEEQAALSLRIAYELREEAFETMEEVAKGRKALERERAQVAALGASLGREAREMGQEERARAIDASVAPIKEKADLDRPKHISRNVSR